ncbi:hypothetical protein QWI17_09855 [Gilvimarinus sp. SDUM040013]|uniref:Uncharacterized protein n=1 Tax=Gilvimarinus gilvus TaxID=3058038 RepID=A0ABU4S2S2_9GAMM|nr:hypothetical protein [Gilvimarinus sp. SDUM040013]MDO3386139.1 hypothetical protein [Gilvimarinus sp. SDUM040013]MDX6851470.1 hypothetical protein [Gilvimarinus sp. SDUM040013]
MNTKPTTSIQSMREAATTPFRKPDLPLFRRLQAIALAVALVWLVVGWRLGQSFAGRAVCGV